MNSLWGAVLAASFVWAGLRMAEGTYKAVGKTADTRQIRALLASVASSRDALVRETGGSSERHDKARRHYQPVEEVCSLSSAVQAAWR